MVIVISGVVSTGTNGLGELGERGAFQTIAKFTLIKEKNRCFVMPPFADC